MVRSSIISLVFLVLLLIPAQGNFRTMQTDFSTPNVDVEWYIKNSTPSEALEAALEYYGVKHATIVYSQSILETGNFKSRICKEYNNLFGLVNRKTHDYFKFNHWSESVIAYRDYVQYKYKGGDYYAFLSKIGYAEDSLYISKVKNIERLHKKKKKKN